MDSIITPTHDNANPAYRARTRKPRHFGRPGTLIGIALMRLAALIFLVGFGYCFVKVMLTREPDFGYAALGLLTGYLALRVAAFAKAQTLSCPLCHGTVLHSKSCHKHRDAHKLPLIGYVWTAIVDVLCRWSFRCMYCGTSFRLKK